LEKQQLEILIRNCINELIVNDKYLFQNDVHEQAITSRLACYILQKMLPRSSGGWDVDVEYNRNCHLPKKLHTVNNIKPDIIIHRRGLNNNQEMESNNLLIIEVKKNPKSIDIDLDRPIQV